MFLRAYKTGWLVAVALLAATGCGGRPVGIKGKITLDGQPLAGATVEFVPEGDGRTAVGITDKEGKFSLSTYKPGDGALRGDYKVVIKKTPERALPKPDPNDKEAAKKLMLKLMTMNQNYRQPAANKDAVPGAYGEPENTPLLQTVPDPKGVYNQELTSKQGDRRAVR